jgi:outer membrane protein TolC
VAIEAAARDSVTMQVVTAWHRVQAARERIAVASAAVAQSETAARIVRDRYEQGLTIITEELRAQTALVSARLELLNARYDHLIGHAELTRAIGGLHDVSNYE